MLQFFTFVLSIFNTVFRGYLIKTFWGWFVLSQFPNLPHISVVGAIGLSWVVSAFAPMKHFTASDLESYKDSDGSVRLINGAIHFIAILFSLGSGWVLHHFFF